MSATWEHRNESEKVPKSVQITINKLPIQVLYILTCHFS